jgi:putative transposase
VALVIDDARYLLNAIAYVLRNPVAAGLVREPGDWRWSGYNAAMGKAAPQFLTLRWLQPLFDGAPIEECRRLLDERIRKDQPYADLVRTVAEGSHDFKKRVRNVIGATLYECRLPRAYRALARASLPEVFAEMKRAERRSRILRAHVVHGY